MTFTTLGAGDGAAAAVYAPQCPIHSVGVMNSLVTVLIQAIFSAQCNISRTHEWPPDYAETALNHGLDEYDFVVVGAGTAGSVVASRLSENPNWKVLVLEAGDDPPQESEVPLLYVDIQHSNFTYNYYVEPDGHSCKAFKGERCYWPRGKMIGGTGGIDALLYVRGNRQDYDRWLAEGNTGWGFDDVRHYFEKSVRPVGNKTHPKGYVKIDEFAKFDEDLQAMIYQGSKELGIHKVREFRESNYLGYSNLKATIKNGHRASTGKSYLGKVSRKRTNLKVIKNAQVTKLNFDTNGRKIKSIEFIVREKTELKVNVRKETVISAGTIDSPKVLMISGVGPKNILNPLDIPIIHELPIGKNLQDPITSLLFMRISANPPNKKLILDKIYQYLIHNKGPFTSHGTVSVVGFINSNSSSYSPYPDIEIQHYTVRRGDILGMDAVLDGISINRKFRSHIRKSIITHDVMLIGVVLINPKSRGNIKIKSRSYNEPPIINANYLSHPDDVEVLLRGLKYIMRLEHTTAFEERHVEISHIPIRECDKYPFKSDRYWRCYIEYFSTTIYNPAGSVKMGPVEDSTSCVDPKLKVKGVENLRVIDASIMPHVISGNINAATIMIAEKGSDMIRKKWSGATKTQCSPC